MTCKVIIGCHYERPRFETRKSNGDYACLRPRMDVDSTAIQQVLIGKDLLRPSAADMAYTCLKYAAIGWALTALWLTM
jgi:hypothetical protein